MQSNSMQASQQEIYQERWSWDVRFARQLKTLLSCLQAKPICLIFPNRIILVSLCLLGHARFQKENSCQMGCSTSTFESQET